MLFPHSLIPDPRGFLLPRFVNAGRRQHLTAKLYPGRIEKPSGKPTFAANRMNDRNAQVVDRQRAAQDELGGAASCHCSVVMMCDAY